MSGETTDLEHVVSILEGVHSKLDLLLCGQQQITMSLGSSARNRDINLEENHIHERIRTTSSDGSREASNVCMELDQVVPQKSYVHLDEDEILEKSSVSKKSSVSVAEVGPEDIAHTMRPRRGSTPTYEKFEKEKGCADGKVMDFHVDQNVSLKGTGRWSGNIFHATIVDIRNTDDTIKVRYSDQSYQRFSRKTFDEAFVSPRAEAPQLRKIIQRAYLDSLGSDSASEACLSNEYLQGFDCAQNSVRLISSLTDGRFRPTPRLSSGSRWSARTDIVFFSDRCSWIMRLPPLPKYSRGVLFFDFLGMLILLKDCILVPYALALVDTYESSNHLVLSMISAAFWTSYLMLKFVTSQDDYVYLEISNVKNSAMHYLKSWFMVDFILAALDWLILVLDASENALPSAIANAAKFSNIARTARVIVVIRGRRLDHLKHIIIQKFRFLDRVWNILWLVVFIKWVNHLGACALIFLESEMSHGRSWEVQIAEMHVEGAQSFSDANLSPTFRYAIAYYLSLSAMFGGASAVIPMTQVECWFATALVLCGVVSVTTIFSSTSAMLMRKEKATQRRTAEIDKLRRFLRQNKINRHLSFMIQRQSMERFEMETRISEEEVLGISSLTIELRDKLRYNLYEPVLRGRPLWRACSYVDNRIIQAMCVFAISFKMYTTGEVVFEEKSHVEAAFTLVWGSMKYSRSRVQEGPSSLKLTFLPGDTACEHALWIEWETVGILEALARCELLVCSSKGLAIVMQNVSFQMQSIISGYAKGVVDFLRLEREATSLSDVSTIAEYDAIVTFMPADARVTMFRPALTALQNDVHGNSRAVSRTTIDSINSTMAHKGTVPRSISMTREQLSALEKQVWDGDCSLGEDESDRVLRIVRAVAMTLQRRDGLICIQVGEIIDGTSKAKIRLPRRKIRMGETVQECSQKMIREYFAALASHIELKYGELDIELKLSGSYSIPTKHMRYPVTALIHDTEPCVGTNFHMCALGDEEIECFAWHCPVRCSVIIYAWMLDRQYESLKHSKEAGEALAPSWLNLFTATDIALARKVIVLV